jgi:hypothetical protein
MNVTLLVNFLDIRVRRKLRLDQDLMQTNASRTAFDYLLIAKAKERGNRYHLQDFDGVQLLRHTTKPGKEEIG